MEEFTPDEIARIQALCAPPTPPKGCARCAQTAEQRRRDHKTTHDDDCPNRGRRVAVQQLRTVGKLPALPIDTKASGKLVTEQVRSAFTRVFEQMGGEGVLLEWAIEHPSQFFAMWSKLVPRESEANNRAAGVTVNIASTAQIRQRGDIIDVVPG